MNFKEKLELLKFRIKCADYSNDNAFVLPLEEVSEVDEEKKKIDEEDEEYKFDRLTNENIMDELDEYD